MGVKRFEVAGVPVDDVSMAASVDVVREAIQQGHQIAIIAVNPEKVVRARSNPDLFEVLSNAELLIPDGIGVVVAARFNGATSISRVPGSELMPELCSMAAEENYSIFLYGASEETNSKAAGELKNKYPGLRIAGRHNGYLPKGKYDQLCTVINSSGADILFLALGSPKQELFIREYRDKLKVKVLQGVGGTFDVLAGRVKRAPTIWQKMHLEWLYRLLSQPSRFFRQLILVEFIWLVLKERLINN